MPGPEPDRARRQARAADGDTRLRVALVGPAPDARGGVAGFMSALLESDLSARCVLVPVVTHRDGSRLRKLVQAGLGGARLLRLCVAGRIDVVHVNSSSKASLVRKAAVVTIARACGRPVVLHLHGSGFRIGSAGPNVVRARRLARWVAHRADAVLAATPAAAADAVRLLGVDDVRVVPNTVAVAQSAVDGLGSRGPTSPQSVLFLGRLERAKGVFELVEAVALVRTAHPDVRLVLAGRGRDAPELAEAIDARGLSDAVDLPGWVDGDEKRHLLSSAACVVLPSHAEGLPLAVLEAMLCGVPVVATAVGGIPEAARDGVEALLVAPGDVGALAAGITRVLDDGAFAAGLADAARRRAQRDFSPTRVSADLARVYADVSVRRPRRRTQPDQAEAAAIAVGLRSTVSSSQRSTE